MKILHIAEFGKRASGIGTVVERLQKEQIDLGHDVRIVTITENIAYKHLEITTYYNQADFCNFISVWRPDAVLFHSIWAMPFIGFAKVLRDEHIPYAVMMHGADSKVNRQSAPFKKWLANTLWFNSFMKKASAVIYLSKAELENCLSANNNNNNVIIPNGCDEGEYDVGKNNIHTPVNIIYVGRLAKFHKGIDYLVGALDILKSRNYKDAKMSFYANENDIDLPYLKEHLPTLEGLASYCGCVYGEEKKRVFKSADAFLLTSRFEGMPMGVLEALSYGVPCILTPGTNMADDLVEAGSGWKVNLNAESIADGIIKAVEDLNSNYHRYHDAAYILSRKYNWKDIAKQHVKMMEDIANTVLENEDNNGIINSI